MRTIFIGLLLTIGCIGSSKSMYGTKATYSVDYRGWVAQNGKTYVFVNPVTGCVVRCRDELQKFAEANASASRTFNVREDRYNTGYMVTAPLSLPAGILLLPAFAVAAGLKDEPAESQREAGAEAARTLRWKEAEGLLLQSAANGNKRAVFKLADIYDAQNRIEDAREAYRSALCHGGAKDGVELALAEKWLYDHGTPVRQCLDTGTEPVDIVWKD